MFSISAHDIDIAGKSVSFAIPAMWLQTELADIDVDVKKDALLEGRLSRSGRDIVVRLHLIAEVILPCARCLKPTHVQVETEISLLLKPSPAAHVPARTPLPKRDSHPNKKEPSAAHRKAAEQEFNAEDADVDTFDGETVVLDSFVREAILLEIPTFPLCSETCEGVRVPSQDETSTTKRKIDPRLLPLVALGAHPAFEDESIKKSKPIALRSSHIATKRKKKTK